ncbi:ATPase WRNIP1-like isoform X1 [Varroa jacobsoni]|uniref:UBZ4-type domain-containing protein n=1 Tax=Varroa destructor TaxID=109461 RepID=A0A7M7JGZ4_VARDE|nr:ATPase WRNIP1-like isoform X1 [Varroa destructor]XP_022691046.1 ATPase WRNIP1-like isoform X1 [Varroa jacobsoni]
MSSSTEAKKNAGSLSSTECPVCNQLVVSDLINQHLDRCLKTGTSQKNSKSPKDSPRKSPSRKKKTGTVSATSISPPNTPKGSSTSKSLNSTTIHPFFQSRTQKKDTRISWTSSSAKKFRTDIIDLEDDSGSPKDDIVKFEEGSINDRAESKKNKFGQAGTSSSFVNGMSCPDSAAVLSRSSIGDKQTKDTKFKPLAEVMRPTRLDGYVGQDDVVGEKTLLRKLINSEYMPSIILWGPPGCGKTTLAHIIASHSRERGTKFVTLSAVASGTKDVKDIVSKAQTDQKMFQAKTILFLDEIHRFNKAQQDVFLPFVEKGIITLIGATTENPSFSLNSALLSRCKTIVLEKLSSENIKTIVLRALEFLEVNIIQDNKETASVKGGLSITQSAIDFVVAVSDGDCRTALNSLQTAVDGFRDVADYVITKEDIKSSLKKTHFLYDRKGDMHYDTISAFHKSMRFGKENAALYYLARMLNGGEDPRFIARRLMVFASEDIGLADPTMLSLAAATHQSCEKIGMPECRIMLSHCTVQFARAPKSRETYDAYGRAEIFVREFEGPHPAIPLSIRNAPTKLMRELGYAKGEYGSCMPEGMEHIDFFKGPPPAHHK